MLYVAIRAVRNLGVIIGVLFKFKMDFSNDTNMSPLNLPTFSVSFIVYGWSTRSRRATDVNRKSCDLGWLSENNAAAYRRPKAVALSPKLKADALLLRR
jgi:urea transporter